MGRERGTTELTRRERQIMDAVYRLGRATVAEVRDAIPDAPSYSAVRTLMGVLREKGHLTHRQEGPRYVYSPVRSREEARASALDRLLSTFFDGSPGQAMAALLDRPDAELSEDELDELADLIRKARRAGR